jgi:hypothetical protein
MDSRTISFVCNQVYHQFPELNGCQPRIQYQAEDKSGKSCYLFIFRGKGVTEDGKSIQRMVRTTVNEQGKILKVTTSR